MEALLVPGMIVGMLALFGVIWFVSAQMEKKRREGMQAVARQLGYEFSESVGGIPSSLSGLHLFSLGRSRQLRNVLSGEDHEVSIQLFDYRYVTGSGKNRRTHNQTVLWMSWSKVSLPSFALRPEHIFHKIGGIFGYQDIDFPAHPQFSKDFLLRGADEPSIRQAFGPVVIDFFERHPGVSAEGSGPDLIFYKASVAVAPEAMRGVVQTGIDLLQRFPRR